MADEDSRREIARLEARVAALEDALARGSAELRLLIEHSGKRELETLSRIRAGLPPRSRYAFDLEQWDESTELTPAEVGPVLDELWRSISLQRGDDDT